MALIRFSRILNENSVHPAQAKAIFQAAWHETVQAFALLLKDDIPRSKGKFSEVASMQALSALEKSLKAVVKAVKAGDEDAAKDALLDADQAARVLMQAEEEQRAKHLTQFVFRAVKDRLSGAGVDSKLVAKWHEIVSKEREIETGLAAFELAQDRATWLPNKELQDISLETEHDYVRALAYVEGMIKRHKDEMKKLGAILKTPKTIMAFSKKHGVSMQYVERNIGNAVSNLRDEVNELDEWKKSLKWSYTRAKTQFKKQGNLFDAPKPTKARKTLAPNRAKEAAATHVPVGYVLQPDGTMKDHRGVTLGHFNVRSGAIMWGAFYHDKPAKDAGDQQRLFNTPEEAAKHANAIIDFDNLEPRIAKEIADILAQYPSDNSVHKASWSKDRAIEQFRIRKERGASPQKAFEDEIESLKKSLHATGQAFEKERLPATLTAFLKTMNAMNAGKAKNLLLKVIRWETGPAPRYVWIEKNFKDYVVRNGNIEHISDGYMISGKSISVAGLKYMEFLQKHHTPTPETKPITTPEPQIKPHGGSSAPRLGNTVAEVIAAWKAEQAKGDAGGFVLMGKSIVGPEMFWSHDKLRISIATKTGVPLMKDATPGEVREMEEDIRRGNFEIYRRTIKRNHDFNKTATGGIAPLHREVLHQATGRQLEAAIIPEAQIAKFKGAATSWVHAFLDDHPQDVKLKVRDAIVDYYKENPTSWEVVKTKRVGELVASQLGIDLKKKDLTDNRHLDTPSNVRALGGNIMAKQKDSKPAQVPTTFPKTEIVVSPVNGGAQVSFPKNPERLASFKSSFKGIRFDWDTKTWFVKGVTAFNRAVKWANAEENGKSLAIQKTEAQANASAELIAARINELVALGGSWIRGTSTVSHHDIKYDEAQAIARTLPNAHAGSMFWSFQPNTADDVSKIIAGFEKIREANKVAREFHSNMAKKVEAAIEAQRHNLLAIPGVSASKIVITYKFAYTERALPIVRGLPGAKWRADVKSWQFSPKTAEDVAAIVSGIQQVNQIFVGRAKAEQKNQADRAAAYNAKNDRILSVNKSFIERVSRAPSVGSTIRRGANVVTITGHGRKYRADEDTSSLGGPIGAEGEYVLDVFYRAATDAERETFEAKENQAKSMADRAKLRRDAIAILNKSNDAPHLGHEPAGETIWQDQSQALYGHWVKVILTPDHQWLWHVTYDGGDGAAWGEYNLGHNLRGSRTKATPELISAIRDPNAAKNSHQRAN